MNGVIESFSTLVGIKSHGGSMGTKIALIDLDGTMADYDLAMNTALAALKGPDEAPAPWNAPHIAARRSVISRQLGFWRNLPVLPTGMLVFRIIVDIGFEPMVLTKGPSSKSQAWAEKVEWCREHLPGVPISITEDKTLTYGRVLVDDWPNYFMPWLAVRPRGLVVTLDRPENDTVEVHLHERVHRVFHDNFSKQEQSLRTILLKAYNR